MRHLAIRDCIVRVLADAGPAGLTTPQLTAAVASFRGRATSSETVASALANFRNTERGFTRIRVVSEGTGRRYTLQAEPMGEDADAAKLPTRPVAATRSLTAELLGDPLPGRSAYDQRHATSSSRVTRSAPEAHT